MISVVNAGQSDFTEAVAACVLTQTDWKGPTFILEHQFYLGKVPNWVKQHSKRWSNSRNTKEKLQNDDSFTFNPWDETVLLLSATAYYQH